MVIPARNKGICIMRIVILAMCLVLFSCTGGGNDDSVIVPEVQNDSETSSDVTDTDVAVGDINENPVDDSQNLPSVDTVDSSDTVDPVITDGADESTDSNDSTDTVEPADTTASNDVVESEDSVDSIDAIEPPDTIASSDDVEPADTVSSNDAVEPADTVVSDDTVESEDNSQEQIDSNSNIPGTDTDGLPAFTNLETGEPVELIRAFWTPGDFLDRVIVCQWFEFDGANYIEVDEPASRQVALVHFPTGAYDFIRDGQAGRQIASGSWSINITTGVYRGLVNIGRTPWLEVIERTTDGIDDSGVRFWILDSHFLACEGSPLGTTDPARSSFFRPTGLPVPGEVITTEPITQEPINPAPQPEPADDTNFRPTDPVYQFCQPENTFRGDVLPQGQTWGTFETSSTVNTNTVAHCVRLCPEDAIELTEIPGWGFDPLADAQCLFDNNDDDNFFVSVGGAIVPVYTGDLNERQVFVDQFAFPLTAGDGFWQCSIEARSANNEPFVVGGSSITFQLTNSIDNWFFVSGRRALQIRVELENSAPFIYQGFAQIDHNSLIIYQTSLDRLNCSRLNIAEDTSLPVTISAFDQAPALGPDFLAGQIMQCEAIESTINFESSSPTGVGLQPTDAVDFELNLGFALIDLSGYFRYWLNTLNRSEPQNRFDRTYRFSTISGGGGELFEEESPFVNIGPTSRNLTTFRFIEVGSRVLVKRAGRQTSFNSRVTTESYFVCEMDT